MGRAQQLLVALAIATLASSTDGFAKDDYYHSHLLHKRALDMRFVVGKKMMYLPNYPRIMERNSREIRDYYYLRTHDPEYNKVVQTYDLRQPKWTEGYY